MRGKNMVFSVSDERPLIDDEFAGEPSKRALQYVQDKRNQGYPVVGIYCGYAPLEMIKAMKAAVAVLCAFSNKTIAAAENVLPANLCPLIKSSYGFIITDTCPFYALSDVVVAETTCDGKKKMFELIRENKPLHVMDLPQLPDEEGAIRRWVDMVRRLQYFLEERLHRSATDADIAREIGYTNRRIERMNRIFDYLALDPPVMSWKELYDLTLLGQSAEGDDMDVLIDGVIVRLDDRVKRGISYGVPGAPRVLITGCPVSGDATKVYRIVEEVGGVIVAIDSCTGMKPFAEPIDEDSGDPVEAMARRYLRIPCSCMTPNDRRLAEIDRLVERFRPDVVIDVVLHACHGYNVESYKVMKHLQARNMPFLQITTDFTTTDVAQIRTRVQALLETLS